MDKVNNYAGFWLRVLSFSLDVAIVGVAGILLHDFLQPYPYFTYMGILIGLFWLYYAYATYKWEATLGKLITGLKVLSVDGGHVTLWQSSVRAMVFFILVQFVIFLPDLLLYNDNGLYLMPILDWGLYLAVATILLPYLMIFFTKRKQVLYDKISQTVVIDTNRQQSDADTNSGEQQKNKPHTNKTRFFATTVIIFAASLFIFFKYIFPFVIVLYDFNRRMEQSRSLRAKNIANDLNDSRIKFYKKELEKYSKEFMEADDMYSIFAADTKRNLALNCIESFLKVHNEAWREIGRNYKKNAINKFANTNYMRRKAKHNEDFIGKHFYDYNLNDVNLIVGYIASVLEPEKNKDTCNALMNAEEMYKHLFLPKYIVSREKTLKMYQSSIATASDRGTLNKSFYRRKAETQKEWLDEIYRHHPKILEKKRGEERSLERSKQKAPKKATAQE